MTLTAKQKAWDATKATERVERKRPSMAVSTALITYTGSYNRDVSRGRGVRTPLMPSLRPRRHCALCPHNWKGHKLRGRCKNGCACEAGKERARGR